MTTSAAVLRFSSPPGFRLDSLTLRWPVLALVIDKFPDDMLVRRCSEAIFGEVLRRFDRFPELTVDEARAALDRSTDVAETILELAEFSDEVDGGLINDAWIEVRQCEKRKDVRRVVLYGIALLARLYRIEYDNDIRRHSAG